jgi:hypothetical protein
VRAEFSRWASSDGDDAFTVQALMVRLFGLSFWHRVVVGGPPRRAPAPQIVRKS